MSADKYAEIIGLGIGFATVDDRSLERELESRAALRSLVALAAAAEGREAQLRVELRQEALLRIKDCEDRNAHKQRADIAEALVARLREALEAALPHIKHTYVWETRGEFQHSVDAPDCPACAARAALAAAGEPAPEHPELRSSAAEGIGIEGVLTVWDHDGRYAGCLGRERWDELLAAGEPAPARMTEAPASHPVDCRCGRYYECQSDKFEIDVLREERKLGWQPWRCANPDCSVVTFGSGYDACPKCGAAGEPAEEASE